MVKDSNLYEMCVCVLPIMYTISNSFQRGVREVMEEPEKGSHIIKRATEGTLIVLIMFYWIVQMLDPQLLILSLSYCIWHLYNIKLHL